MNIHTQLAIKITTFTSFGWCVISKTTCNTTQPYRVITISISFVIMAVDVHVNTHTYTCVY